MTRRASKPFAATLALLLGLSACGSEVPQRRAGQRPGSPPPAVPLLDAGAAADATPVETAPPAPPPQPLPPSADAALADSAARADAAPPAPAPPAANGVRCEPRSGASAIVRASDGQTIGAVVPAAACQQAARDARHGAVCSTPSAGSAASAQAWYPTALASAKRYGGPLTLSLCAQATLAAHSGVVCAAVASASSGRFKAVNLALGLEIGRYPIPEAECFESTRHARNGVVCSHTGVNPSGKHGFKPTNIARAGDKGFMGSSAWLDYCRIATLNAGVGRVCANGNGGTGNHAFWYEHDISRQSVVQGGRRGDVYACSGATKP